MKPKFKFIATFVHIHEVSTGGKYMVQFVSNTHGLVYKDGKQIADLEHVGGLANKTKALLMIKQALGICK